MWRYSATCSACTRHLQALTQLTQPFHAHSRTHHLPFSLTHSNTHPSPFSISPQQADTQKQAAVHECTDPESCKRQIVEDFKYEAPLWKLTCYGHWKYLPCDIVGDVSCEELRTAAYEDAKRGLTLQSIVERERNLLNSKVSEFDNLLWNPLVLRSSGPNTVNQFPVSSNTVMVNPQSNKPHLYFLHLQQLTSTTSPVLHFLHFPAHHLHA